MGLFSPKVPDTISDRKRAALNRRANKADRLFSAKSIARRKASQAQRRKSAWS